MPRTLGLYVGIACAILSPAQVPTARAIVTVGHRYGEESATPKASDLTVSRGLEELAVVGLTPLRDPQDPLELYVVVDNCSSCEPGSKFEELKKFLLARSASTKIGVAYIQDGKLQIALNPTTDHALAAGALNPPSGSTASNPFNALKQLIQSWPASSARRVVLMISNGIDPASSEIGLNQAAEAAIEAAQRNGIPVFAIYHPGAGYETGDFTQIYSGQVQLAHVANESGGEAYVMGIGPLPSLAPFLSDIANHLANQYLLEFIAKPLDAGPGFEEVTIKTKNSNLEILAPSRVWVPERAADNLKTPRPTGVR
jgi:hypothetical protein